VITTEVNWSLLGAAQQIPGFGKFSSILQFPPTKPFGHAGAGGRIPGTQSGERRASDVGQKPVFWERNQRIGSPNAVHGPLLGAAILTRSDLGKLWALSIVACMPGAGHSH